MGQSERDLLRKRNKQSNRDACTLAWGASPGLGGEPWPVGRALACGGQSPGLWGKPWPGGRALACGASPGLWGGKPWPGGQALAWGASPGLGGKGCSCSTLRGPRQSLLPEHKLAAPLCSCKGAKKTPRQSLLPEHALAALLCSCKGAKRQHRGFEVRTFKVAKYDADHPAPPGSPETVWTIPDDSPIRTCQVARDDVDHPGRQPHCDGERAAAGRDGSGDRCHLCLRIPAEAAAKRAHRTQQCGRRGGEHHDRALWQRRAAATAASAASSAARRRAAGCRVYSGGAASAATAGIDGVGGSGGKRLQPGNIPHFEVAAGYARVLSAHREQQPGAMLRNGWCVVCIDVWPGVARRRVKP
eukprot:351151-Chlamydomonas_euryale.AAC.5